MKPSHVSRPRKAPSVPVLASTILIINPRTEKVIRVTTNCSMYDLKMLPVFSSISFGDILIASIHSLPKRIGEYQSEERPNATIAETKIGRKFIVFIKLITTNKYVRMLAQLVFN